MRVLSDVLDAHRSNVVFDGAANWNLHIAGNIYLPFVSTLTGTMITFEVSLNSSEV